MSQFMCEIRDIGSYSSHSVSVFLRHFDPAVVPVSSACRQTSGILEVKRVPHFCSTFLPLHPCLRLVSGWNFAQHSTCVSQCACTHLPMRFLLINTRDPIYCPPKSACSRNCSATTIIQSWLLNGMQLASRLVFLSSFCIDDASFPAATIFSLTGRRCLQCPDLTLRQAFC